jgi:hypothetical protein
LGIQTNEYRRNKECYTDGCLNNKRREDCEGFFNKPKFATENDEKRYSSIYAPARKDS